MSARFLLFLLLSTLALSTVKAEEEIRQKREIFTVLQALLDALGLTIERTTGTVGGVFKVIPVLNPLVGSNGQPLNLEVQPALGGLGKGVDGIVGSVLGTVINDKSATGATGAPVATTTVASA